MGSKLLQSRAWNIYMWPVTGINFVLVISLYSYALQHLLCHPKHLVLALSKAKPVIKWFAGTSSILNHPFFWFFFSAQLPVLKWYMQCTAVKMLLKSRSVRLISETTIGLHISLPVNNTPNWHFPGFIHLIFTVQQLAN